MSGAALRARGLVKRFGRAQALASVDCELAPGGCLALLGPNGAGKSTLLRLAAGLARPSAGELSVDGQPGHGAAARRRVGYLGHASLLYSALSARENLRFAARLYGVPRGAARVEALLREEELEAVADRPLAGFSRGMAQRVAILRALVHEPALLLLDEPFAGLDRGAAGRLAERIDRLRGRGHSLLIATHDVARVARLADAALVLRAGRVVHRQQGSLDAAALERAYDEAVGSA